MSGTLSLARVSQLTPRTDPTGTVVVAYDGQIDSYTVLAPSALRGLQGAAGPQGIQGPQGLQGPQGVPGANGATTYLGTGAPTNQIGANGDYYIDGASPDYTHYGPKTSGAWPATTRALRGPQGVQGAAGIQGIQGPQGVQGSAGTPGLGWRFGTGAPLNSVGINGDYYLDTASAAKNVYGPKAAGAWPGTVAFTLQGPQGPAGTNGTGGGGTGNVTNGTLVGQIPVWDGATYAPTMGTSITGDRTPTVEITAASLALTFAAHNRRNLVGRGANALTLAASEVGTAPNIGMSFAYRNRHTAQNTLTFGTGLTVDQPANGTGTGGQVKIPAKGTVAVTIYPEGSAITAEVRGEVA